LSILYKFHIQLWIRNSLAPHTRKKKKKTTATTKPYPIPLILHATEPRGDRKNPKGPYRLN